MFVDTGIRRDRPIPNSGLREGSDKENGMKKAFVALAAAVLALGLGAFGPVACTPSKPAVKTVGISMPTKSSARWIADGSNMVKEFEKLGYKTDLQYAEDV